MTKGPKLHLLRPTSDEAVYCQQQFPKVEKATRDKDLATCAACERVRKREEKKDA